MRRAPSLLRVLIVLLALAQALGSASSSIADARLLAANPFVSGSAHIEEYGTNDCPRSHPLDCALCQYVSSTFRPAAPGGDLFVATRAVSLPHGPAEHQRAAAALRQPPSRGPPATLAA